MAAFLHCSNLFVLAYLRTAKHFFLLQKASMQSLLHFVHFGSLQRFLKIFKTFFSIMVTAPNCNVDLERAFIDIFFMTPLNMLDFFICYKGSLLYSTAMMPERPRFCLKWPEYRMERVKCNVRYQSTGFQTCINHF